MSVSALLWVFPLSHIHIFRWIFDFYSPFLLSRLHFLLSLYRWIGWNSLLIQPCSATLSTVLDGRFIWIKVLDDAISSHTGGLLGAHELALCQAKRHLTVKVRTSIMLTHRTSKYNFYPTLYERYVREITRTRLSNKNVELFPSIFGELMNRQLVALPCYGFP